ncbi:hypothetical protein HY498_00260 [Candidatus Woesearchaeota archaeon]|nr:hypothetical protein [Candidatus Woesearchaeota archaeon]
MRLITITLILVVLFSGLVSAASFSINNFVVGSGFRGEDVQINATIVNGNSSITLKVAASDLKNNNTIITPGSFSDIILAASETKAVSFKFNIPTNVDLGDYKGSFTFTNSVNNSDNIINQYTLKVDDRTLLTSGLDRCSNGIKGNLIVKIKDPDNNDNFNPGDQIKIKAEVENIGTDDLDVQVEADLFNIDERDSIVRAKSEVKEIRDGADVDFEFFITVPTTEIDENDKYILFLKAVEDPDRETLNCYEEFVNVDLDRKSSDVVIEGMSLTPSTVECGDILGVKFDIENIGKKDQDVSVKILNELLGISQVSNQIRLKDADSNDKDPKNEEVINFDVKIPQNAKPGNYVLEGEVVFDGSSNKKSKTFIVNCDKEKPTELIKVSGIKGSLIQKNIDVKSGDSFSLAINVKNDLKISKIINLDVQNIAKFGDLISGDSLIQLNPGESKTNYFFIKAKDVVQGSFSGVVNLIIDGNIIDSVLFNVDVESVEKEEINFNVVISTVIVLIVILLLLSGLNRKI